MSKPTTTYLLLEERLKEPLSPYVRARRTEGGKSWASIAIDLYDATSIRVTPETLRNWFAETRTEVPAA
jgi:hypothetical protein